VGELVVRNLIRNRELPAVQGVDGRWRIDLAVYEEWIQTQVREDAHVRARQPPGNGRTPPAPVDDTCR